jgi:hypothetical protein
MFGGARERLFAGSLLDRVTSVASFGRAILGYPTKKARAKQYVLHGLDGFDAWVRDYRAASVGILVDFSGVVLRFTQNPS